MSQSDEQKQLKHDEVKKRGNVIFRQELRSLTPKCDATCAIVCNLIMLVIFLIFGIPIVVSANSVIEFSEDYTNW